jgi:hypothetical protein
VKQATLTSTYASPCRVFANKNETHLMQFDEEDEYDQPYEKEARGRL